MPLDLTNACARFEQALDIILTKYKWKTFLVYLYYVFIFSNNVGDHIKHFDEIWTTLVDGGFILKIA